MVLVVDMLRLGIILALAGHGIGIGRRLLRLDVLLDVCPTVFIGPSTGWEFHLLSAYPKM